MNSIALWLKIGAVFIIVLFARIQSLTIRTVPCEARENRQFDFWVGDWDAFDLDSPTIRVARTRVDLILDGCVLREDYEGSNGLKGQSFTVWFCLVTFGTAEITSAGHTVKVTLLGTGTPFPNVKRFGSAILVEADGEKLLFDCGRGAVIRLSQIGVPLSDVDALFLTHLHSDHIVGIPDLWLSGWFLGRDRPLRVWGPPGTREMTEHLSQAYGFDVQARERAPENLPSRGAVIDAHEVEEGSVYVHGPLRVSAFVVDHGLVKPAFGYRVDLLGHSVVISGDTKFSQNLIDHSKGADCLIHVAWSVDSRNPAPRALRSLASAEDAAHVFSVIRPKLAVIYHYLDPEGLTEAVREHYKGPFVVGNDLMVIEIGGAVTWHEASSGKKN